MLHAVNAEHCPRKRWVTSAQDLLSAQGYSPTLPMLHPSFTSYIFPGMRAGVGGGIGTAAAPAPELPLPFSSPLHHSLILGVTSPTGFRYVSSIFLASVAAYSSRCRTSPALPGEPPGARCPRAAHKSPVSGASSAEPAHSRF